MHFDYLLSWGVGELSCINISILSKEWDGGGTVNTIKINPVNSESERGHTFKKI